MSPNKSNSCSHRESNISIMTSVFCLHLHNQRGWVGGGWGGAQDDCCLLWLLCGCCRAGADKRRSVWWNGLRLERTALKGTFDLVWAVSGQTAERFQGGKSNKRRVKSEKSEGPGENERQNAPLCHPGMIWKPAEQRNRSRWPRCPLSFALAPPEKFPLKHTEGSHEQKGTHTQTERRHACPQTRSVSHSCSERHLISPRLGTPSRLMPLDTHNMRSLIFSYFSLGKKKNVLTPSQGRRVPTNGKE